MEKVEVRQFARHARVAMFVNLIAAVVTLPFVGIGWAAVILTPSIMKVIGGISLENVLVPTQEAIKPFLAVVDEVLIFGLNLMQMSLFLSIVGFFVFITWLYLAHKRLALVEVDTKCQSWEALVWWFVPGVNFVRPYQVLKEVWTLSRPMQGMDRRSEDVESSQTLALWWMTYLVLLAGVIALGIISTVLDMGGSPFAIGSYNWVTDEQQLAAVRFVLMFLMVMHFAFLILTIFFISETEKMQVARLSAIAREQTK